MKPLARYLEWALRVVIGCLFLYAAWAKRNDGVDFADSIASFKILPSVLVIPFTLAIPPFEASAGAMVLTGWHGRVAALGLLVMSAMYSAAIASALAGGTVINCGCFGTSVVGSNPWIDLSRDLLIAAGCAVLYRLAARTSRS